MLNTDYDIEKAFKAIEDELIASMILRATEQKRQIWGLTGHSGR